MSRVLDGINQVTQKCNITTGGTHRGTDVIKQWGSLADIIAHSDGEVTRVQTGYGNMNGQQMGFYDTYGNMVDIKHSNGYTTRYAHLDSVNVEKGDIVKQGQKIGYMGNTGHSFGGHLHFEVHDANNNLVNADDYIDGDLPNMNMTYIESNEYMCKMYQENTMEFLTFYKFWEALIIILANSHKKGLKFADIPFTSEDTRIYLQGYRYFDDFVKKFDNTVI